ncbi:MAG: hypothetical protein FWG47_07365, partial [Propionibacteriaceae bacterium]|nr:hypothetical protein [Propionibacteriaceae bacterium]
LLQAQSVEWSRRLCIDRARGLLPPKAVYRNRTRGLSAAKGGVSKPRTRVAAAKGTQSAGERSAATS